VDLQPRQTHIIDNIAIGSALVAVLAAVGLL